MPSRMKLFGEEPPCQHESPWQKEVRLKAERKIANTIKVHWDRSPCGAAQGAPRGPETTVTCCLCLYRIRDTHRAAAKKTKGVPEGRVPINSKTGLPDWNDHIPASVKTYADLEAWEDAEEEAELARIRADATRKEK